MSATLLLERLEALYQRHLVALRWQEVIQNRIQAAAIARRFGHTDLFEQYSRQAIASAEEHGLQRLELQARFNRFSYLLAGDRTGQTEDELKRSVLIDEGENGLEIRGEIGDKLERYASEALMAYDQVLRACVNPSALPIDALKLARQRALAFSLAYIMGQFDDALELLSKDKPEVVAVGELVQTAAKSGRSETSRICDALRVDLFLLGAELRRKLGSWDVAEMILERAEQLSASLPEQLSSVYRAWADFCSSQGKIDRAQKYAQKSVEAAEQSKFVIFKDDAKLHSLLGSETNDESMAGPLKRSGVSTRVMSTIQRADQALLSANFTEALRLVEQALAEADEPLLRRMVLGRRMVVLFEMGRLGEAEADLDVCLELLSAELASDALAARGSTLDTRTLEEESLYLQKAFLRAKAGQSTEAWNFAEQGRSRRLRREIHASSASLTSASIKETPFNETRNWLRTERVAIMSFAATRWGTLALTAAPDDVEPDVRILERFTAGKLKRLLGPDAVGPDGDPESIQWNDVIRDSIPTLSAGLIQPLGERLRCITQSAKVLYIIPDGFLYYAPFAALTLESSANSPTLIDLCPVAHTPSISILLWCISRRYPESSLDCCLAVACGKDTTGFGFSEHLKQIGSVPWRTSPVELRDQDATVDAVANQAPLYPVLYFSCHGKVSAKSRDLMSASELQLAGKAFLTALDVAQWKLRANLVFLNACQSGRFRLEARSDVNGFVRAFLLAGATSIIAPLIHVNPLAAGDFAEDFFRAWVAGADTAEAMRAAQFTGRQKNPESTEWATYCLTGDFH
jgi:tetratricopeptide (TPR) repeat protein